ncbi:MAG: hypothetical protein BIFFINMI_02116 [Phycisphaerae bacterium]|nr:hypothetical protein [Phycisphaerae bacterium]
MTVKPLWVMLSTAVVATAVASVVSALPGCSNLRMDVVADGPQRMDPEGCADCHAAIHGEWADSPHARAFSNAPFQAELATHAPDRCVRCHAPLSVLADGPIAARPDRREQGVNCMSCHFTTDCRMAGPNPAFDLHPVQPQTKFYRDSAMCGRCHESTYAEWLAAPTPRRPFRLADDAPPTAVQAGELADAGIKGAAIPAKPTCQECHMAEVTRRQTDDPPFNTLHPAYRGRTHIFSATDPRLIDGAIGVELLRASADEAGLHLVVAVANVRAMHSVPTGSFGHREMDLIARLEDADGTVVCEGRQAFLADLNTALAPGERREVELTLQPERRVDQVRLSAQRIGRDGQTVATLGGGTARLDGLLDMDDLTRRVGHWPAPAAVAESPATPAPAEQPPGSGQRNSGFHPPPVGLIRGAWNDVVAVWAWANLRAATPAGVETALVVVLILLLAFSRDARKRR